MTQALGHTLYLLTHDRGSQELVEEARRDRQRFAELYALYAPPLFRYFWVHTRSRQAAEDLLSETFVNVLHSLPGYSLQRGSFSAWLYGIARRAMARHAREQARLGDDDDDGDDPVPGPMVLMDGVELPLEQRLDLWDAVGELTTPEREIVALKFGGGLTHKEIAEVTGLREIHVGVVLYRALEKLREYLAGEGKLYAKSRSSSRRGSR